MTYVYCNMASSPQYFHAYSHLSNRVWMSCVCCADELAQLMDEDNDLHITMDDIVTQIEQHGGTAKDADDNRLVANTFLSLCVERLGPPTTMSSFGISENNSIGAASSSSMVKKGKASKMANVIPKSEGGF